MQEVVCYGKSREKAENILDTIEGYQQYTIPLIDSDRLSSKAKWREVERVGGWDPKTFFAQGLAILFREETTPHFPVWDLPASAENNPRREGHFIENVHLESGLYFGDRNTEPRAALVAHFVFNPESSKAPLDIFVINLHLTTLLMEREGIPGVDLEASRIRMDQLRIIFKGIISRYNIWKQQKYPERGKERNPEVGETFERCEPVWILAGDFNFTPESGEYEYIERLNFIDVVPLKGSGTKAKGAGNPATLTVDYIFAGPKYISLDPVITSAKIKNNYVYHETKSSDHYPMYAKIPITITKNKWVKKRV